MGLHWDSRKVAALRQALSSLQASSGFRSRANRLLAAEAVSLVQEGFRQGKDPYGRDWLPLKRNRSRNRRAGGASLPLRNTGRLMRSFSARPVGNGFFIDTDTDYAVFHNFGTVRLPVRQMVPDSRRLPPAWEKAFAQTIDEAIRHELRGVPR